MQSEMTIPLMLQNIHYNLLNECNSVMLALSSHSVNKRPPQFFLFSGFLPLLEESDTLCRGKKMIYAKYRGNFLLAPGHF